MRTMALGKVSIKAIGCEKTVGKLNVDRIIWLLTVILFASIIIFAESGGAMVLFGITIIIFFLSTLQARSLRLKITRYQGMVLLFATYCAITALWSENSNNALSVSFAIIKMLICTTVIYTHYSKFESIEQITRAVMWAGYIVVIYSFVYYGPRQTMLMLVSSGRLENAFANVNTIAMLAATSVMISVFFMAINKRINVLLIALDLISLLLILASGSRKALVLMIAGVIMIIMFKSATKNVIKTVTRWIGLGIILFFVFVFLLSLPVFDSINVRMKGLVAFVTGNGEMDNSAWVRQNYIRIGIEQFKKTPLIGMGMNNTYLISPQVVGKSTYLHNNFVELLAGGGIVGFILFYRIYVFLLAKFWESRKCFDDYTRLCIVWIAIHFMMHYGAVVYYYKETYVYLTILFLQTEKINRVGVPQ